MKVPLSRPEIGETEIENIVRVLRSGHLSLGPRVAEFEERFAEYIGVRHAVAVNSGTSALHLAVMALGLGPEDEVLTSPFSFVASTNCLLYEKAVPVFADIQHDTLNLDPREIRKIIELDYSWDRGKRRLSNRHTGRVLKAILPVHVFGMPCEMTALMEIAREFNLRVIEDACEALGAEFQGQRAGTFGDAAVFAFYPNKQLTTAEGGMLVTNQAPTARLCRSLRNQGRDEDAAWLRHIHLGFNYRLSDLHAAVGLAQIERIEYLLAARSRVAAWYARHLAGISGLTLPAEIPGSTRSWFVYVVQLSGAAPRSLRDHLMKSLRSRGIECTAYFPAIHHQPYFGEYCGAPRYSLARAESAADRCLALPFFPAMSQEQVAQVCAAVREILEEAQSCASADQAGFAAAASSAAH